MNILYMAIISICMSVAAQFSFRHGMASLQSSTEAARQTLWLTLLNPYIIFGFILYGLGALIWLNVLQNWEVSKAYPMVGFGFALAVIIGLLLGESVNLSRIIGVALICSGVYMVARG